MRDFLTNPAWQPADLGRPLPDTEHAVSVALPCWQDVVDYEEEKPRIAAALRTGYPRFFLHPQTAKLMEAAVERYALPRGWSCLVFPSRLAALRCRTWIQRKCGPATPTSLHPCGQVGAEVLGFPETARRTAREYWRYCGETVSSRMAMRLLDHTAADECIHAAGAIARTLIAQRLGALHGVPPSSVFLFPSGMAAISALHRAVVSLQPEKPTVQLDFPYVDVLKVQQEFGGAHFFPVCDEDAFQRIEALAATRKISGVFCEMPSNPLLRCVDAGRLSAALKPAGIPLIIDDTIAGVANIDALRFADAVTTSLTKAFSGAGDVMAGSIVLHPQSPFHAALAAALTDDQSDGNVLWCEDAVTLETNSRDFPQRMARMSATAAILATALRAHPAVGEVYYPDPKGDYQSVARPGAGCGSLLSFVLKNPADAPAVYDRLRISKGPSLGTNFSICCPFTMLAHYQELPWAASCGVRADLLRLSAGLEDPDDLLARLHAALASCIG